MAITFQNFLYGVTVTYGASPRTQAITPPSVGDILVVWLYDTGALGGETVSDNQGNTYTLQQTLTINSGTAYCFTSPVLSGTMPTSLSITWTGGGSRQIQLSCAGVSGSSGVDVSSSSGYVYVASQQLTYTTANASEGAIVWLDSQSGAAPTVTEGGWSTPATGNYNVDYITYNTNVGAAGSGKTVTLNWSGATHINISLLTFTPSGGGGGGNNVTHAAAFRNQLANLVNTTLGSGAQLVLRMAGTVDSPGAAVSTLTFNSTAFNSAVNGVITAYALTSDSNAAGNANAPTTCTMQTSNGTVLLQFAIDGLDSSLSGGNIIASGDTVSCSSLTYNAPQ